MPNQSWPQWPKKCDYPFFTRSFKPWPTFCWETIAIAPAVNIERLDGNYISDPFRPMKWGRELFRSVRHFWNYRSVDLPRPAAYRMFADFPISLDFDGKWYWWPHTAIGPLAPLQTLQYVEKIEYYPESIAAPDVWRKPWTAYLRGFYNPDLFETIRYSPVAFNKMWEDETD